MNGGKILLYAAGLTFSVVPPLVTTLTYFPLWTDRGGGAMLSGLAALLLLFSFVPLFNLIRTHIKTPSAPMLWFLIFLVFFLLAEIAAEMRVISLVGLVGNLIGSVFFHLAKRHSQGGE